MPHRNARPSPALVVAALALVAALAGTAVAADPVATTAAKKVTKKKVKKIARKQADKQITNRAPGLSVANADNAANADRRRLRAQVGDHPRDRPRKLTSRTSANSAGDRGGGIHRHVFRVRAIDPAGNADPTPAKRKWELKRKRGRGYPDRALAVRRTGAPRAAPWQR